MKLISSDNPSVIEWQVQQAISEGYDMVLSPFVFFGHFNQWMEKMPTNFEYKLVSAFDLASYEKQVALLSGQGYFLHRAPVDWDGAIYQWMARSLVSMVRVERSASFQTETFAGVLNHSFNLVERVQKIPFPLSILPGGSNG